MALQYNALVEYILRCMSFAEWSLSNPRIQLRQTSYVRLISCLCRLYFIAVCCSVSLPISAHCLAALWVPMQNCAEE